MSRTKLPNARVKPIGTQVSEAEYAAVEAARGDVTRSQWIHELILGAIDNAGIRVEYAGVPAPVKPERKKAPSRVGPDGLLPPRRKTPPAASRRPVGAPFFREPGGEETSPPFLPPAPAKDRTRCTHKIFRQFGSGPANPAAVDGCCPECGHRVLDGGWWAPECDAGTCGHD